MVIIQDIIEQAESPDERERLEAIKSSLEHEVAKFSLEQLEQAFDADKQKNLDYLLGVPQFVWFMDNLILPQIKPPKLNMKAEISPELLYDYVVSDAFTEIYTEYLIAKRRKYG